jgi:hypothetical protein
MKTFDKKQEHMTQFLDAWINEVYSLVLKKNYCLEYIDKDEFGDDYKIKFNKDGFTFTDKFEVEHSQLELNTNMIVLITRKLPQLHKMIVNQLLLEK